VHASVVDPLASSLVAQSVDVEIARFDGNISEPTATGLTYTRNFGTATDDYSLTLDYVSSGTANGSDFNENAISGFKWWNFTFPTVLDSGSNAVSDFISATGGSVNFGGSAGTFGAWGESYAIWNDPANPNGWALPSVVLMPEPAPLGIVAAGYSNGTFTMTVAGGVNTVVSALNTTSGSGTLVYQIDRTNNIVTISSVDITTAAGQNALTGNLVTGTPAKVFGVPQANGTIKAYVVFYYTGTKSSG
jgi:hypothetical protein